MQRIHKEMHQKRSIWRSREDLYQDLESEVGVSDEDGGECVAPESDEEIVDEMLCQSPMKNSTRSKSLKVIVPEPLIPLTQRTIYVNHSNANVITPVQLRKEQGEKQRISGVA